MHDEQATRDLVRDAPSRRTPTPPPIEPPTRPAARGGAAEGRALGWFSIGLGATLLAAPRAIGRLIGTNDGVLLLRGVGVRELATGALVLGRVRPDLGIALRVAGDVLDLGLARIALDNVARRRATLLGLAGVTALDIAAGLRLSRSRPLAAGRLTDEGAVRLRTTIRVNASPDECYAAWSRSDQLPRWMSHLERVEPTGDGRSRWVVRGSMGTPVVLDVETVRNVPGTEIGWRSMPGSMLETEGAVRFDADPHGRGTLVRLDTGYRTPIAAMWHGLSAAWNTDTQQKTVLRRFKAFVETGELPTTAGQSAGTRGMLGRLLPVVAS